MKWANEQKSSARARRARLALADGPPAPGFRLASLGTLGWLRAPGHKTRHQQPFISSRIGERRETGIGEQHSHEWARGDVT